MSEAKKMVLSLLGGSSKMHTKTKLAETNTKVLRIFFFRPSAGCVAYEYFWSSFVFETEFRRPLVDRSQRCVGGVCGGSGLCHIF